LAFDFLNPEKLLKMPNEKNKTNSKKTTRSNSRKPNPTVDRNVKFNERGKDTQSQSNTSKRSGVGRKAAAKKAGK
jgi:hypothetical protein